jgi:hypothetical protein
MLVNEFKDDHQESVSDILLKESSLGEGFEADIGRTLSLIRLSTKNQQNLNPK